MPQIIVFDSGAGGLTIAGEIAGLLPGADFTYIADNAFFPYGTKDEAALIDRVELVLAEAVARSHPDLIVIACNTASTVVLPRLRARFTPPVVGVLPAVKPAAAASTRRIIGLLGTPGTVCRAYTHELITRHAGDCQVLRVGSADLVEWAEALLMDETPPEAGCAAVLAPFFDRPSAEQPDCIVLACTHFPLLRAELMAAAPAGVRFIDSGSAVARRVQSLLPPASILAAATGLGRRRAWFTRDDDAARRRWPGFARHGFTEWDFLDNPAPETIRYAEYQGHRR